MKTLCIYHSRDLDGWMSAAEVKKWFNKQEVPNRKDGPINTLDFLCWDYGHSIPDSNEYDRVIMVDISFPATIMLDLNKRLGNNFIWIDHHISAIKDVEEAHGDFILPNGLRDEKFAACELTWKWFFPDETMPEIVRLLGRYDCFGHKQVWKPVISYEGLYEVSNHGNVRSLDRIIIENNTNKERRIKGKDLSIANSKRGYRVVVLCKDGTEKMRNVHQLVMEAFIPNPENKPCINHKDFNRLNNYVTNLEWCTYTENNLHSIEEGVRGKTVIQLTKDEEFVQQFDSIKRAELYTGIASQNIGKVCKGERVFAGDYKWEYGIDKDVFPQFIPEDEEQKVLMFQYAARASMSNYEESYHYLQRDIHEYDLTGRMLIDGEAIYKYLCTEAKQIYARSFLVEFKEINPNDDGLSYLRKFLAVNQERFNPINFGIDYHKDGYDGFACFWHKDGKWNWSLYNDNGKVDCSVICKQHGGGGHRGAAGFVCDLDSLIKLIK